MAKPPPVGYMGLRLAFGMEVCVAIRLLAHMASIRYDGRRRSEGGYRRTMIVNNHVLRILVAQPVSLGAVREVNYLRLEASSLHDSMVCLGRCWVNVST
jgi:hypothetical protein